MKDLMYDAQIEHSGKFCDFVEFCYKEHDSQSTHMGISGADAWYEERLAHIWKNLRSSIVNIMVFMKR
jgi:hypothetical protein